MGQVWLLIHSTPMETPVCMCLCVCLRVLWASFVAADTAIAAFRV